LDHTFSSRQKKKGAESDSCPCGKVNTNCPKPPKLPSSPCAETNGQITNAHCSVSRDSCPLKPQNLRGSKFDHSCEDEGTTRQIPPRSSSCTVSGSGSGLHAAGKTISLTLLPSSSEQEATSTRNSALTPIEGTQNSDIVCFDANSSDNQSLRTHRGPHRLRRPLISRLKPAIYEVDRVNAPTVL
jgi:hypothetical protein